MAEHRIIAEVTTHALDVPTRREPEVMPVHGIDHLELYVGNAAQAAYYYGHAFGFTETAYRGLETGTRDRVSHVLEQGRIRLVLTGTLTGADEIADHHHQHGDGVRSIALSVPDAARGRVWRASPEAVSGTAVASPRLTRPWPGPPLDWGRPERPP